MVSNLVHATQSNKAKAIEMVGFRVTPRTRKGTAYCKKGDFDCVRDEAYRRAGKVLEQTRQRVRPDLPTRNNAVFFFHSAEEFGSEPDIYVAGEDDWGRPLYDFGFGKDVAFEVDPDRIPCTCGVGDMAVSDDVFKHFVDQIQESQGKKVFMPLRVKTEKVAEQFWRKATVFDARAYDQEKAKHELPEVWCPCRIDRHAIVAKYDKNHPIR